MLFPPAPSEPSAARRNRRFELQRRRTWSLKRCSLSIGLPIGTVIGAIAGAKFF